MKQEGALKFSKQKLKMDIKNGTLSLIKADGTTEYNHSKGKNEKIINIHSTFNYVLINRLVVLLSLSNSFR